MPDFLRNIKLAGKRVTCLETDAIWYDLGRPEDLILANSSGLIHPKLPELDTPSDRH